jgi:hypothetical protein
MKRLARSWVMSWQANWKRLGVLLGLAGATSCSVHTPLPPEPAPRAPAPAPAPVAAAPMPAARSAAPPVIRTADELRRYAAQRLVDANPERTYMSRPPPILLAIPVLEVELNSDGSVKRIGVMRKPGQALDTVQIAMDAIRRAAPFGDLRRMQSERRFVETFLFDDQRRFKPRTLD